MREKFLERIEKTLKNPFFKKILVLFCLLATGFAFIAMKMQNPQIKRNFQIACYLFSAAFVLKNGETSVSLAIIRSSRINDISTKI